MQCQVACKRLISKSRQELHTVMKEVQLLKQFNHVCKIERDNSRSLTRVQPNLNQVFHYEVSGEYMWVNVFSTSNPKLTSREYRYIFLELATGGDLFSYIDFHRTLGGGVTRWISYQLMKGLEVWR